MRRRTSATSERSTRRSTTCRERSRCFSSLALGPALAVIAFVWWGWGRERGTSYDREYEQEPPTETQPALVPGLLARAARPGRSSSRPRSST